MKFIDQFQDNTEFTAGSSRNWIFPLALICVKLLYDSVTQFIDLSQGKSREISRICATACGDMEKTFAQSIGSHIMNNVELISTSDPAKVVVDAYGLYSTYMDISSIKPRLNEFAGWYTACH